MIVLLIQHDFAFCKLIDFSCTACGHMFVVIVFIFTQITHIYYKIFDLLSFGPYAIINVIYFSLLFNTNTN